jgi:valyl-tRNA synthetase
MGLEFMNEVPFPEVYIHGLIRDAQGRKMSKSLGNGVDPIEVIEEYGADALRFALATAVAPGYDMKFRMEKVEAARNFANKLWNAARFVQMNLVGFEPPKAGLKASDLAKLPLALADRWILSRLMSTVTRVNKHMERYDLGEAGKALYDFIWSEFCDWYIELAKPRLYGREGDENKAIAQFVIWFVLEETLRLLHPYMPFVTEEIWQKLPHEGETLMMAAWPKTEKRLLDHQAEREMELVMEIIRSIRNMRAEANVPLGKKIDCVLAADLETQVLLAANQVTITSLAGLMSMEMIDPNGERPEQAMTAVVGPVGVFLPLAGLVDIAKETGRLKGELAGLEEEECRLSAKLGNEGFVAKAPAEVVAREREKLSAAKEKAEKVRERLAELSRLS